MVTMTYVTLLLSSVDFGTIYSASCNLHDVKHPAKPLFRAICTISL
jgi:hypothetical protein